MSSTSVRDSKQEPDSAHEEDLAKLKKSRAGHKGVITRTLKEIERLTSSFDNLDSVIKLNDGLSETWSKFAELHNKVLLAVGDDEHEQQQQAAYYDDVRGSMVTFDAKLTTWIDKARDKLSDAIKANDSASQMSQRSSSSSIKLKRAQETAARRAAEVRLKHLQEEAELEEAARRLEEEQHAIQRKTKLLKAQAEIAECKAREEAYEEARLLSYRRSSVTSKKSIKKTTSLDPKAAEFNPISSNISNSNPTEQFIRQASAALYLPKQEIPTFKGDPLEYTNFMVAFKNIVEDVTPSPSARLNYLVQYTSGDVQDLVKSCLVMDPVHGYEAAHQLLKTRYGQNYKIATAYVDRITKSPPLKSEDLKGLQKLSVLLTSCCNTLKTIGYINKIENPETMRSIVSRLPFDLRKRWRSRADNISEEQFREIQFDDLVKFIEKEVRLASHPVFGNIVATTDKPSTSSKPKSTKTFTAVAKPEGNKEKQESSDRKESKERKDSKDSFNPPPRKCPLCAEAHGLFDCASFKAQDTEARISSVQRTGVCFNCLLPRHYAKDCRKRQRCDQCGRKHNTLLHKDSYDSAAQTEAKPTEEKETKIAAATTVSKGSECVGLPVLAIDVQAQDGSWLKTNAFLDTGSNMSFCSQTLVDDLGLSGKKSQITLTTLDHHQTQVRGELFSIVVKSQEGETCTELRSVMSRPALPITESDIATQKDISRWPHLEEVKIQSVKSPIGLLIGNDHPELLQPLQVIHAVHGGPYAVRTCLGWTVNGPLGRHHSQRKATAHALKADALSEQFKIFCNQEWSGSLADDSLEMSRNDARALDLMNNSVKLKNGHYELDLPLSSKCSITSLPNNIVLAKHRLESLKTRLNRDDELKTKYTKFMEDLFVKKHAEQVPEEELGDDSKATDTWYLPHHAVTNPNKPGKVRVVFDCSAKYRGICLNDQLLQGPDFNNTLLGVLIRFRRFPIAISSDVEAMFYQVFVSDHHRDLLRFLWWKNGDTEQNPQVCRMKVHIFGAKSSPSCCTYALKRTATDNKHLIEDITQKTILNNFYMDDCLVSVKDIPTALNLRKELVSTLALGGFKLTKWMSNSPDVLESIPEEEQAAGVQTLDISHRSEESPIERALGVRWNLNTDEFTFHNIMANVKSGASTRRGLLSVMSAVFDPMGFICPVVLPVKMILQELCRLKLGWDDPIPEKHEVTWKNWLADLSELAIFSVPRSLQFGVEIPTAYQLHIFSDASEVGYGCVAYLRTTDHDGAVSVLLLLAKSHVAPLKSISIPRMELNAATLSVRLNSMIKREFKLTIQDTVFWTDSTAVLKYINNEDKRFHTYVANRISVIRDGSSPRDWRYVPSRLNPADDTSRGMTAASLVTNKRWLYGPEYLRQPEDQWPKLNEQLQPIGEEDPEVKSLATISTVDPESSESQDVLDKLLESTSSWFILLRRVAWLLRFKNLLRQRAKTRARCSQDKVRSSTPAEKLTSADLVAAEKEVVKMVQAKFFAEDISTLKQSKALKGSSSLYKLNPMLDDGLLRIQGRLTFSSLNKKQYILPKKHHVTDLVILHYHHLSGHSGRQHTLAFLRTKFWIIHGNAGVRRVLSRCITCKKVQGKVGEQKMADVPEVRLGVEQAPFTHTGVDFFGPFLVKRGRSRIKKYVLLLTCLVTRAVHMEVTPGLDTDSFLNGLNRFIARRGKPQVVCSDNGGCFVKGEKEVVQGVKNWNQNAIRANLLQKSIDWRFNPPLGSHHGGVWERCIRTARKILNTLLKQQVLDEDGLQTLFCEVEAIMNSRPITQVSDDPNDLEALTPNHLMLFNADSAKWPMDVFTPADVYHRRWRQIQHLADTFWKRWTKEYLPLLMERQKWNTQSRNFSVGDLVLLVDQGAPRTVWPLGRVVQVFRGRDGLVRQVQVQAKSGVYNRPIDKIVLLEGCDGH